MSIPDELPDTIATPEGDGEDDLDTPLAPTDEDLITPPGSAPSPYDYRQDQTQGHREVHRRSSRRRIHVVHHRHEEPFGTPTLLLPLPVLFCHATQNLLIPSLAVAFAVLPNQPQSRVPHVSLLRPGLRNQPQPLGCPILSRPHRERVGCIPFPRRLCRCLF